MLLVSPPLSLVEQKPQQTDTQTHQQEAQHHPRRLALPAWRLAAVAVICLCVNSSAKKMTKKKLHIHESTFVVWSKKKNDIPV